MTATTTQTVTGESDAAGSAAGSGVSSWRSFILQVSAIALLFICLLVGHAFWRTGSLALVWPYLAGQRLFFEPTRVVIGPIPKETQVVEREVRVINSSSKALRLLGAQKTCGCIALDEFPIVIPAGEERSLRLKIAMPREPGSFKHSIKLFSDEPGHLSAVVTIAGIVP